MKHKLFCFILILILILGSFAFVFAEDDFYYPMISYEPNDPTFVLTYSNRTYYAYSNNYPIYAFGYYNNGSLSLCYVSNYNNASIHRYYVIDDILYGITDDLLSYSYNSVYYYTYYVGYDSINNDFPIFNTRNEGLIAFDNYFKEQGSTNDTVFNLGVFVAACLQFVAATASFIMQYPILMMFVLLPVISYIVILLRRLLMFGS